MFGCFAAGLRASDNAAGNLGQHKSIRLGSWLLVHPRTSIIAYHTGGHGTSGIAAYGLRYPIRRRRALDGTQTPGVHLVNDKDTESESMPSAVLHAR